MEDLERNLKTEVNSSQKRANGGGGLTWVEAARIVLERYECPISHKDILKVIQDENLRTCLPGQVQLACLNAMLNANCRGSNAVFYRAPGQNAFFGMKRDQASAAKRDLDQNDSHLNNKGYDGPSPAGNAAESVRGGSTAIRSALTAARSPGAALRVMPPKKRPKLDESDVVKFPAVVKQAPSNQGIKTEKSSANSVVKRVLESQKRNSLKKKALIDDESVAINPSSFRLEEPISKKNSGEYVCLQPTAKNKDNVLLLKLQKPKGNAESSATVRQSDLHNNKRRLQRTSSAIAKAKIEESEGGKLSLSDNSSERSEENASSFLEVKFKRLKKMSHSEQLKRATEGRVDMMTPDSILASVEMKSLINLDVFKKLPPAYQYQLMMLLPAVDKMKGVDNVIRITNSALNNEFFAKSCQEWRDKLCDGDFNTDIIQKIKSEAYKESKLDPWKKDYFEPQWGTKHVIGDIEAKESDTKSAWETFLHFSEDHGRDHLDELQEMQLALQKEAEEEKKRKIAAISKASITIKANKGKQNPSSNIPGGKSRSKRSLKKAQLLQMQLKEAKAKVVADARSSSKKNTNRMNVNNTHGDANNQIAEQNILSDFSSGWTPATDLDVSSVSPDSLHTLTSKSKPGNAAASRNRVIIKTQLNSSGNTPSNTKLQTLEMPGKKNHSNHQKSITITRIHKNSKLQNAKSISSRIIRAASIYSRGNSLCPCSLSPLLICEGCGAFCHQDCISIDKRCTLCTAAC